MGGEGKKKRFILKYVFFFMETQHRGIQVEMQNEKRDVTMYAKPFTSSAGWFAIASLKCHGEENISFLTKECLTVCL